MGAQQQFHIQLICIVVLVLVTTVISARTCYHCGGNPNFGLYDPNCGDYAYDNKDHSMTSDYSCSITIFAGGWIDRGPLAHNHADGFCEHLPPPSPQYPSLARTICYCNGDYCNTNSFCEQCGSSQKPAANVETDPVTFIMKDSADKPTSSLTEIIHNIKKTYSSQVDAPKTSN